MSEVDKIIKEIEEIQKQPYQNSISAMGKQHLVNNLHAKLDELGYEGERPPRNWSQLNPEGKFCYKHPEELMNASGQCKICMAN